MSQTRQLSRICFIERLGSPASSDLTLMFMNERRREVTTEAMNFLSILFDVTLTGKGSGPIAKRYHNHTRQSSQTRHRTTSAREAQVMANEAQRVTEAINAMSMPKLVSVSTGANASTHTTLAPVPAPLVGSRLVRVAQVRAAVHRSGQADLEVRQDTLPAPVQGTHQEAQVEGGNLTSHAGSLQRVTAKGVTNARLNTETLQHQPRAEGVPRPQLKGLRTRNPRRTKRTKRANGKRRTKVQRPVHVFKQVSQCLA